MSEIVLVDENDTQIGVGEKIEVHKEAQLHRAFSVWIFNSKGEVMLQKRASKKYHSGGLWTNTCCSHPFPNEPVEEAVHRRLPEEMGFDCELEKVNTLIYKASFDNGLTEHEFLHVFKGIYNEEPKINEKEADDWKWVSIDELKEDVKLNPENYTEWFKIVLPKLF